MKCGFVIKINAYLYGVCFLCGCLLSQFYGTHMEHMTSCKQRIPIVNCYERKGQCSTTFPYSLEDKVFIHMLELYVHVGLTYLSCIT